MGVLLSRPRLFWMTTTIHIGEDSRRPCCGLLYWRLPGSAGADRSGRRAMGHSQESKAASHERIVSVAAARFREAGIDGIGVVDLLQDAGMSHRGFYRHFAARDDLVA